MDRLVDHLLIMEGQGIIRDFPGNYSQYRVSEKERTEETVPADAGLNQPAMHIQVKALTSDQKKKLSYKEKRELESLDEEIRNLTQEKESINKKFNEGGLPFEEWHNLSARMQQISLELDHKEMRWLELSELQ
jgi:ATP-binding cassette subfamily F protein uup